MERVFRRRHFVHLLVAVCLAVPLALGLCGSAAAQSPPSAGFERLVDVGGHRLYVKCMGSGAPTVILEPGINAPSDHWWKVQPEVARFTRVCSYDRANLGRSDRGPVPRTSQTTVNELRALLSNAGIGGPYVLVGHSIGGFHVQLFARQDGGASVVGAVFVDARPVDFHEAEARYGWPPLHELPNQEGLDVLASNNEVKAAPAFPNIPLVVLTHTIAPPGAAAGLEQAWREQQLEQSRFSPRGELVVAECATHDIHLDRPDLVIAAIARASSLAAPSIPAVECNTPPPPGEGGSNTPSPPEGGASNTSPGPQVGASAPFPDCPPLTANVIRDSAASNSLVGSTRGDRIFAGTGNDVVDGLAGDDCIDLGPGTDRGQGGAGADLILGGLGRDRMSGSSGNDRLLGGASADRLIGGAGDDRISGGSGSDKISARDRRRDRVNCGSGRDSVIADRADRVARNCERVRRR